MRTIVPAQRRSADRQVLSSAQHGLADPELIWLTASARNAPPRPTRQIELPRPTSPARSSNSRHLGSTNERAPTNARPARWRQHGITTQQCVDKLKEPGIVPVGERRLTHFDQHSHGIVNLIALQIELRTLQ